MDTRAQSRTAIVSRPSVEKNNTRLTPRWRLCGSRPQVETLLDMIDRHYPDFRVRGSRARHDLPPAEGVTYRRFSCVALRGQNITVCTARAARGGHFVTHLYTLPTMLGSSARALAPLRHESRHVTKLPRSWLPKEGKWIFSEHGFRFR